MAGPSIVVRVLGDLKGLGTAMEGAGKSAQGAAASASKSFGSLLNGLNQTGVLGPFGTALSGINDAIGNVIEHAHQIGPAMIGAGAAVTGLGALLSQIGSKEQASHQQLQAAIDATGHSYEEYGSQIEAAIKHQEKYGHTADQTQDALRALTQATHDPAKAIQLLGVTSDLAAAKHMGLSEAATAVGRTYNGNTRLLKQFGIEVTNSGNAQKALTAAQHGAQTASDNLAKARQKLSDIEAQYRGKSSLTVAEQQRLRDAMQRVQDATSKSQQASTKLAAAQDVAKKSAAGGAGAIDSLAKVLHGQAAASADTFGGKISAMRARIEDAVATFGQKWGPTIQMAGIAIMGLGTAVSMLTAIQWAEVPATLASMAPFLLIAAAIAALIAIVYVLYRNWSTIWGAIKAAVEAVWNWIKTNWPLLLGILLGPIGIAVTLIIKYWNQIKAGAGAVINWLRGAWDAIAAFFASVGARIAAIFSGAWHAVQSAAGTVVNVIKGAWNGLVSFFTGIGSRIAGIASGFWHAITRAASLEIQGIKIIWNGLVSFFTGIPGRIAGIAKGMFHGITEAFRGAINALIDIWNRLHFKLPDIHFGPIHLSGPTIGVPRLPHLAQGGLITADGLVYAHAGEAITPARDVGKPSGPAVVINDAHFGDPVDVDVFMRRVAWQLQRQAV